MIVYEHTRSLTDAILSLGVLTTITTLYPDFRHWYINRVMPGVVAGTDTLIVAKDGSQIIGVALSKRHASETKLRCVRVTPQFAGRGIGLHLIDKSLRAVDNDKPLCTVPQELFDDYARAFINHYKFDLTSVAKGMYRKNKLEYIFNE